MTGKSPSAKSPRKDDDRNLVDSSASASGPTLEEYLMTFWEKYRTSVYAVIVAALLIIVGREGWRYYSASREASIRDAYLEATTAEERQAFARDHQGHPLAGLALLSLADEAYAAGDFALAMQRYGSAAGELKEPVLAGRARLGEGMAALQAGVDSKGVEILTRLGDGADSPQALRTEAWYHLAALAVANGEVEKASEYLEKLTALEPTGIWASRAAGLKARMPSEDAAPLVSLPGS